MPAYSGLRVAQLRELCEERNIDHGGLTKPQLLEALRAFDRDEGGAVSYTHLTLPTILRV